MRGAERTFAEIAACWPRAPIYTLLFDSDAAGQFADREVHTSYLQMLGMRQRSFRFLMPLFPRAVEHLPVQDYDVIVSSSSAFAHGIRPASGAMHVCYCHSPFRYAWFEQERALSESPRLAQPLVRRALNGIRSWDRQAARRVTRYIANSATTRERIERIYGVDSEIVHPPVAVERFSLARPEDYVLFVGQIVRHKRVDVAIKAACFAGRPIKIVGDGPDLPRLKSCYQSPAVEFLGSVSDARLADLYSRCAALIVPNVEEFGIAAVESQAAGRPVVGVGRGGLCETVIDGVTGILVEGESAEALAEPLRDEDFARFDSVRIRAHAERFSASSFRRAIVRLVDRYSAEHAAS